MNTGNESEPTCSHMKLSPVVHFATILALIVIGCSAHLAATFQPPFMDEFVLVQNVGGMVTTHTIFPSHTQYPSLYTYLIAPVLLLNAAALHVTGILSKMSDLPALVAYWPPVSFWGARLVSFFAWLLTVGVTWLIGRELFTDRLRPALACLAFTCVLGTLQ